MALGGLLNSPFEDTSPWLHGSPPYCHTERKPPAADAMSSLQSKHLHLTALISTAKVTGGGTDGRTPRAV